MPELPEVETTARGLDRRVRDDVITSIWLTELPQVYKSPAQEIARVVENARILGVRRAGKHIVIDLESHGGRAQWIVHLGMTGRMLVAPAEAPLEKHTHAIARLASGRELRFVDPRRFGKLAVTTEFAPPGKEPLDVGFELFLNLFRGRKTPIKSALLNQKLLSGVGNIYADESLFRAGIRSRRRAVNISRAEFRTLYDALQQVLNEAIAAGGSSVSDYVDAEGERGLFQFQHRVYGREGEPCLVCRAPVKRVVIAGRSSHYCPRCQK